MASTGKQSLVQNEELPEPTAPPGSLPVDNNSPSGSVPPAYTNYEAPPPYTPGTNYINCKVCQNPINLDGKQYLNVVKCGFCRETTPIKNAPSGKRYVRCACNCLIVCKATAPRIVCPRPNCRRILQLYGMSSPTAIVTSHNALRATCGHCNNIMGVDERVAYSRMIRCSTCRQLSVIGTQLKHQRAALFGSIGGIFLLIGVIVTVVTLALSSHTGFYVIWIGAFVAGICNLIRSCMWCGVRVSHPVQA